jgi:hypothetical protein
MTTNDTRIFEDAVTPHLAATPLTEEQITALIGGIADTAAYAVYSSSNGRSWTLEDIPRGEDARNVLNWISRGHTVTGTDQALTAAPDGTSGNLGWYHMILQGETDA